MKIDFENEFLDYILSRGYEYCKMNKVSNITINNDLISATVNGDKDYKVNLEIKDNTFIDGDCSCPYFETNGYCKHMAAVLYYLSDNKICKTNNNYNLENIVNKIAEKDLRKFLYNNLENNNGLLNRFRVEFSNYFPKLSKENYRNKIYKAINNCYDCRGFIDYNNTSNYENVMYEFTEEARKLVDDEDYETAFIIITVILDSIPNTNIDDSNGSTSLVAEEAIEIIFDILDVVDDKNSAILKKIMDYVIDEVKTANLYNYGIDLKQILARFIDDRLYLDDIQTSLEIALDNSRDKKYFHSRQDYVEYLIKIYELKGEKDQKIKILEKYSYDTDVFLKYIDELIKNNNSSIAIKALKERLDEKECNSRIYANKLAEIYLKNNMMDKYSDILYKLFYKFDKYDIDTYRKIKKLYSNKDWDLEKNKIIENMKNDNSNNRDLNEIFIEEKMYDELYSNVCDYNMDYVKQYEQYLLPKYRDELLNIYKNSCFRDAKYANNRSNYRLIARKVNYIMKIDNSNEIVKSILKEFNEKYFLNRPAMLDEFQNIIKDLNKYIQ